MNSDLAAVMIAESRTLSLRERNKITKRQQIKQAAREVFGARGYDGATLREIAKKADVALGTVMLYAQDKRDLVLLMYNDEIESLLKVAASKIHRSNSFLTNLIAFFRPFYEGYAKNLRLARTYLQINFFSGGMNTSTLQGHRAHKLRLIAEIIAIGQAEGMLRKDVSSATMAKQILYLHRAAVRAWIADEQPKVKDGLAELKKLLSLQIEGFGRKLR